MVFRILHCFDNHMQTNVVLFQMPEKCILSGAPSPVYLKVFPQFSFEVTCTLEKSVKLVFCC